ncbi:MAG: hypothetical protein ACJAZ9_000068 [Neolewinella sp.]|jgi:hypothetical protein
MCSKVNVKRPFLQQNGIEICGLHIILKGKLLPILAVSDTFQHPEAIVGANNDCLLG